MVAGYSFGDQHLDETIYETAERNPRSSVIVFCHETIPDELAEKATRTPSITVAATDEAIWGGRRGKWKDVDIPGVAANGKLLLTDFQALARYLPLSETTGS